MNYINKFKTTNEFETAKEELNKLKHFVAYDAESKKVYLKKYINPIVKPSESSPCDICLYDKTNDKLIIVKGDMWNIETYPSNKYSPVGVVLIPGTHNVYGDGSCCVMSLKEMNCTTPDNGSTSYQNIYWGGYGTDIPSLTNYDEVCYVGSNGNVNKTVQGVTSDAYLPSDKFSTVNNPYDTDTSYYYNNSNKYVPSPYNNDDTRNTEYYRTSLPSSSANAMSDFNGKENTKIITDLATTQSDWKTAEKITNSYDSGYYPAACCCLRYHTEGTKQGDWYLPSCGELGYIMPKFNKINEAITKLINGYGSNFGVVLHSYYCYWSSSEYSSKISRGVGTDIGNVNDYNKRGNYYVRACVRVR